MFGALERRHFFYCYHNIRGSGVNEKIAGVDYPLRCIYRSSANSHCAMQK
jgi:hypothetical protein